MTARLLPVRAATVERVCKRCEVVFLIKRSRVNEGKGRGTFCSRACQFAHRSDGALGFTAQRAGVKARNRAFVDEVNARTVCAHCGAQPIEWHNPEHVELGRQLKRIGILAGSTSSLAAIRAEMDRCTPLCRRCHMREDGRMDAFMVHASRPKSQAPKPCGECSRPYKPLRRGLCTSCYARRLKQAKRSA